jgi:hypothetical protein
VSCVEFCESAEFYVLLSLQEALSMNLGGDSLPLISKKKKKKE